MEKVLVSACLLGEAVRYDGKDNLVASSLWQGWQQEGRLVGICPECAGGLPTPRPPAEIRRPPAEIVSSVADIQAPHSQASIRVVTVTGDDVTAAFVKGAEAALRLARDANIRFAILKARSPSCGKGQIYDGSFSRTLTDGDGITAALLSRHGIEVFTEYQLQQLAERLA
ncbi:DUF523 domain-containing protein [Shewanella zhangzhouensis]|uniref:DUF523 domain-containing protein n=1 Tax=Shewanella zhangzhouensis TaxID=2864213 RepID=UPI001C656E7C|nr:DUF523 domain-containing protein [Shewanella zhangzhouensis]QYK04921.1 DUF523 domain-containing protein [Shewanella zhangzhouensis]